MAHHSLSSLPGSDDHDLQKITLGSLLVTLGIIYGDIGTSPLYVMKAIIGDSPIESTVVFGGLSCIFWTLTLQTTLKYVLLALRADNNGEGGIFALFNLVKKNYPRLIMPAIIGAAALIADGIITPPISVSSAVEGLRLLIPDIPTLPIIIGIISLIFLFQRFGTVVVGKSFGPLMSLWFLMLGILGFKEVISEPSVLKAVNPYYAFQFLLNHPSGLLILGAVFLCTTGAEALYSDLGHCGKNNIRVTWIFVKICLILNYMGQGAWLLAHQGRPLEINPFYAIMPPSFLGVGIVVATLAAIIASQALITGTFTLIAEAINHDLWPKVQLRYPTELKGQLYVPSTNILLWVGCLIVIFYFKESTKMEAAYGLSITVAMLMTTFLMCFYLHTQRVHFFLLLLFALVFGCIEATFFLANLHKFSEGGYVTVIIGSILISVMLIWKQSTKIKARHMSFAPLPDYMAALKDLSRDDSISKYATHLVFLTNGSDTHLIDTKIIYSIFYRQPKRADIYWFVHVVVTDAPYTMEYHVDHLAAEDVVRVTFYLGFKVEQRIEYFVRKVVEEMVKNREIDITSRYNSLRGRSVAGDFHFIILERFLSIENELTNKEELVLNVHMLIKHFISGKDKWYGIDTSSVTIEKVPLVIRPLPEVKFKRV